MRKVNNLYAQNGWRVVLILDVVHCFTWQFGYRSEYDTFSWTIQIWDERKNGTGYNDNPIMYDNGTIAYDFPERIPQQVKNATKRFMTKLKPLLYPDRNQE